MFRNTRSAQVMQKLNERLANMTRAHADEAKRVWELVDENLILKRRLEGPRPPFATAETLATQRHLTEERAENKRLRAVVKALDQTNRDTVEYNRFELKKLRRAAKIRADESERKQRTSLHRANNHLSGKCQSLQARIKTLEAHSVVPLETMAFLGRPVSEVVDALHAADDLARAVTQPGTWRAADEIAKRFLELRTPPAPKPVDARTNYFCPVCGGVAKKTDPAHGFRKIKPFFCPKSSCAWEGSEV